MEHVSTFAGAWLAQRDDGMQRIIQLIALALFLGGPLLAQLVRKLTGGPRPPARPAPVKRSPPTPAEERGGDLWRQLMELEDEQAAPTAERRPADPLADPDVERVQPRPRAAPAPRPAPTPIERPADRVAASEPRLRPNTANEARLEARSEARQPAMAAIPTEDVIEEQSGRASGAMVSPMTALSVVGPPQLVARRADARFLNPTRDELRRAMVLNEILGVPVGLRSEGRGGHDPMS